ncbi:hypothetical protein INT44_004652 [Umbelopsis vinacea]|uniref:Uncharacterized protein n=1 Tax=Umbelopsis vinacea TaxID=44442 RepID=A0A8H7QCW2_9FUNG|nr:hypothetical protein INT44_004652 [Umbelopsis vinacea]
MFRVFDWDDVGPKSRLGDPAHLSHSLARFRWPQLSLCEKAVRQCLFLPFRFKFVMESRNWGSEVGGVIWSRIADNTCCIEENSPGTRAVVIKVRPAKCKSGKSDLPFAQNTILSVTLAALPFGDPCVYETGALSQPSAWQ